MKTFREYINEVDAKNINGVNPGKKQHMAKDSFYRHFYDFDDNMVGSIASEVIDDDYTYIKKMGDYGLYKSKKNPDKWVVGKILYNTTPLEKGKTRFGIVKSNLGPRQDTLDESDILLEAEAKFGNYKFSDDIFKTLTDEQLKKGYDFVEDIKDYKMYREKQDAVFVLIDTTNGVNSVVFSMKISRIDNIGNKFFRTSKLKIRKLYNVDGVAVKDIENIIRQGLASEIYQYLVLTLGYSILGDKEQYLGARRLWSRLSINNPDVKVDIVNIDTGEIIISDYNIKHGKSDDSFDPNVWTTDDSTHHIRTLLTAR